MAAAIVRATELKLVGKPMAAATRCGHSVGRQLKAEESRLRWPESEKPCFDRRCRWPEPAASKRGFLRNHASLHSASRIKFSRKAKDINNIINIKNVQQLWIA